MISYQKDLILNSVISDLQSLQDKEEDFKKLFDLNNWIKNIIDTKLPEPCIYFVGKSKNQILLESKDYINFPQKELLTSLISVKSSDSICTRNLKLVDKNSSYKSYYIKTNTEFYKKFMMSVGLLDKDFKYGYVYPTVYKYGYSSYNATMILDEVRSYNNEYGLDLLQKINKYINDKVKPSKYMGFNDLSNYKRLDALINFYTEAIDFYTSLESYCGIEKFKDVVLAIAESEKSK